MSATSKSKSTSAMLVSIRKFSEDPRLRPFLSSHFDSQSYIKGVIADGKSEDCFAEISSSIEEVNEEIKGYISAHHENLMGGMQDVALLATRYAHLSHSAKKIKGNIDQLKQETFDCHELIRMRSTELERIHQTSIILRQFRQFMHAKGQLDYYLKTNHTTLDTEKDKSSASIKDNININGVNFDIRNLANTAAKLVYELETLISIPMLCEIKAVSSSADSIRLLGRQLRQSAQDRFLVSIKDRSQASIAACLQIFFHLQSLPEILLLAIDNVAKTTAEAVSDMLDLNTLVLEYTDLASQSTVARSSSLSAASLTTAGSSMISNTTLSRGSGGTSGSSSSASSGSSKGNQSLATVPFPTSPAIRRSLKEIVTNWATYVYEQSLQINILQRVIAKKEDPNSQRKFSDILKSAASVGSLSPLLAQGKLLELFWQRLMSSLQDICNRLVKIQPVASSRIYPYLRRAALDIIRSLKDLSQKDIGRDSTVNFTIENMIGADGIVSGPSTIMSDDCAFGSLSWQPFNMLDSIAFGSGMNRRYGRNLIGDHENDDENGTSMINGLSRPHRASTVSELFSLSNSSGSGSISDQDPDINDSGLLIGLKPLRDRYLIGALSRMNHPVHQMFPEMEGYTAAIPSKRDLQTLIKAIQTELVTVILEGDLGLIRLVSREALKSLQLIASKVEDMILNTSDARRINPTNSFAKNHAQEHNSQLIILLSQLKDAIKKLPDQVIHTAITETNSSNSNSGSSSSSGSSSAMSILSSTSSIQLTESLLNPYHGSSAGNSIVTSSGMIDTDYYGSHQGDGVTQDQLNKEISMIFQSAILSIDDLAAKQLYAPLLDNIMIYIKSVLITLPSKEGIPSSAVNNSAVDCSKTVQLLQKQIPEILQSFLLNLPKSSILSLILEEFALRTMHMYVTVASIIRPVNEYSRLRTSQDLSAVEDILVNIAISDSNTCKVVQEFKAFRRLLFMDENSNALVTEPTKAQILSLPYISNLRPSIVLGYLISCAPAQLPSPYDVSGLTISAYVDILTSIIDDNMTKDSKLGIIPSIRNIYFHSWKRSKSEQEIWTLVQVALDTFLQRISVLDGKQKGKMRQWYELILDIGGHYFDK